MSACPLFPIICLFLTVADVALVNIVEAVMSVPWQEDYNGDIPYMPSDNHNSIPQYGNSHTTKHYNGNQRNFVPRDGSKYPAKHYNGNQRNFVPRDGNKHPAKHYNGIQQVLTDYAASHYQSQHYGNKARRVNEGYKHINYLNNPLNKPYGQRNIHVPRHTAYKQTGGQQVKNGMEYNKQSSYANFASHVRNAKSVTRFGTPQKKKFYWPYYPYSASDYGNPLYVRGNEYKQDTQKTNYQNTEYHGKRKANGVMKYEKYM